MIWILENVFFYTMYIHHWINEYIIYYLWLICKHVLCSTHCRCTSFDTPNGLKLVLNLKLVWKWFTGTGFTRKICLVCIWELMQWLFSFSFSFSLSDFMVSLFCVRIEEKEREREIEWKKKLSLCWREEMFLMDLWTPPQFTS